MESYFVYSLSENGIPFWIGASRNKNRLSNHLAEARTAVGNSGKNEIIARLLDSGSFPEFTILADNLSVDDAYALEIKMIEEYGRLEFGGSLVNLTEGGKGKNITPSLSEKRSLYARQHRKRPPIKSPRINVSFANDQIDLLASESGRLGISTSGVVRRIVDLYFEKAKRT